MLVSANKVQARVFLLNNFIRDDSSFHSQVHKGTKHVIILNGSQCFNPLYQMIFASNLVKELNRILEDYSIEIVTRVA